MNSVRLDLGFGQASVGVATLREDEITPILTFSQLAGDKTYPIGGDVVGLVEHSFEIGIVIHKLESALVVKKALDRIIERLQEYDSINKEEA